MFLDTICVLEGISFITILMFHKKNFSSRHSRQVLVEDDGETNVLEGLQTHQQEQAG